MLATLLPYTNSNLVTTPDSVSLPVDLEEGWLQEFLDLAINHDSLSEKRKLLERLAQIATKWLGHNTDLVDHRKADVLVLQALQRAEVAAPADLATKVKLLLAKIAIHDLPAMPMDALVNYTLLSVAITFILGVGSVGSLFLIAHSSLTLILGIVLFSVLFMVDQYSLTFVREEYSWQYYLLVCMLDYALRLTRVVFGVMLGLSIILVPVVLYYFITGQVVLSLLASLMLLCLLMVKYKIVDEYIKDHSQYIASYRKQKHALHEQLFGIFTKINSAGPEFKQQGTPAAIYLCNLYLNRPSANLSKLVARIIDLTNDRPNTAILSSLKPEQITSIQEFKAQFTRLWQNIGAQFTRRCANVTNGLSNFIGINCGTSLKDRVNQTILKFCCGDILSTVITKPEERQAYLRLIKDHPALQQGYIDFLAAKLLDSNHCSFFPDNDYLALQEHLVLLFKTDFAAIIDMPQAAFTGNDYNLLDAQLFFELAICRYLNLSKALAGEVCSAIMAVQANNDGSELYNMLLSFVHSCGDESSYSTVISGSDPDIKAQLKTCLIKKYYEVITHDLISAQDLERFVNAIEMLAGAGAQHQFVLPITPEHMTQVFGDTSDLAAVVQSFSKITEINFALMPESLFDQHFISACSSADYYQCCAALWSLFSNCKEEDLKLLPQSLRQSLLMLFMNLMIKVDNNARHRNRDLLRKFVADMVTRNIAQQLKLADLAQDSKTQYMQLIASWLQAPHPIILPAILLQGVSTDPSIDWQSISAFLDYHWEISHDNIDTITLRNLGYNDDTIVFLHALCIKMTAAARSLEAVDGLYNLSMLLHSVSHNKNLKMLTLSLFMPAYLPQVITIIKDYIKCHYRPSLPDLVWTTYFNQATVLIGNDISKVLTDIMPLEWPNHRKHAVIDGFFANYSATQTMVFTNNDMAVEDLLCAAYGETASTVIKHCLNLGAAAYLESEFDDALPHKEHNKSMDGFLLHSIRNFLSSNIIDLVNDTSAGSGMISEQTINEIIIPYVASLDLRVIKWSSALMRKYLQYSTSVDIAEHNIDLNYILNIINALLDGSVILELDEQQSESFIDHNALLLWHKIVGHGHLAECLSFYNNLGAPQAASQIFCDKLYHCVAQEITHTCMGSAPKQDHDGYIMYKTAVNLLFESMRNNNEAGNIYISRSAIISILGMNEQGKIPEQDLLRYSLGRLYLHDHDNSVDYINQIIIDWLIKTTQEHVGYLKSLVARWLAWVFNNRYDNRCAAYVYHLVTNCAARCGFNPHKMALREQDFSLLLALVINANDTLVLDRDDLVNYVRDRDNVIKLILEVVLARPDLVNLEQEMFDLYYKVFFALSNNQSLDQLFIRLYYYYDLKLPYAALHQDVEEVDDLVTQYLLDHIVTPLASYPALKQLVHDYFRFYPEELYDSFLQVSANVAHMFAKFTLTTASKSKAEGAALLMKIIFPSEPTKDKNLLERFCGLEGSAKVGIATLQEKTQAVMNKSVSLQDALHTKLTLLQYLCAELNLDQEKVAHKIAESQHSKNLLSVICVAITNELDDLGIAGRPDNHLQKALKIVTINACHELNSFTKNSKNVFTNSFFGNRGKERRDDASKFNNPYCNFGGY